MLEIILFIVFCIPIIIFISLEIIKGIDRSLMKCPECGSRFMKKTDHGVSMYSGIWVYHYTCRRCNYEKR